MPEAVVEALCFQNIAAIGDPLEPPEGVVDELKGHTVVGGVAAEVVDERVVRRAVGADVTREELVHLVVRAGVVPLAGAGPVVVADKVPLLIKRNDVWNNS
jgi:hypothetical protein